MKKQLREKEREIVKLKGDQSVQASQKNVADEETDKRVK